MGQSSDEIILLCALLSRHGAVCDSTAVFFENQERHRRGATRKLQICEIYSMIPI